MIGRGDLLIESRLGERTRAGLLNDCRHGPKTRGIGRHRHNFVRQQHKGPVNATRGRQRGGILYHGQLRTAGNLPNLLLEIIAETRLGNLSHDQGPAQTIRAALGHGHHDFIAQILAEALHGIEHLLHLLLRLVRIPPVAQNLALVEPVFEDALGIAQHAANVRDGNI